MNSRNITWHKGEIEYSDRCKLLGQQGVVLWFTGLSGSGKSTIAVELEKKLHASGKAVYRLDGDNIRHGLNSDLGFSRADRNENIRRVAEVARLFCDAGLITLVSFISPYKSMRQQAENIIGSGNFVEIYVKADIETCIKRDPKGLYEKAQNGKIVGFTGISAPYEEPQSPDILLSTDEMSLEEAVNKIISETDMLIEKNN